MLNYKNMGRINVNVTLKFYNDPKKEDTTLSINVDNRIPIEKLSPSVLVQFGAQGITPDLTTIEKHAPYKSDKQPITTNLQDAGVVDGDDITVLLLTKDQTAPLTLPTGGGGRRLRVSRRSLKRRKKTKRKKPKRKKTRRKRR